MKTNYIALGVAIVAVVLLLVFLFMTNNKARIYNAEGFAVGELGVDPSLPQAISVADKSQVNPDLAASGIGSLGASDPTGNEMYNPVDGGSFASASVSPSCFPRDTLSAQDLLPKDAANSKWAQLNPAGQGDIRDQNFLTAGIHYGINTIGSSMKNPNLQLRSEPPCPQIPVSIFNNSTITPDVVRKELEIGN